MSIKNRIKKLEKTLKEEKPSLSDDTLEILHRAGMTDQDIENILTRSNEVLRFFDDSKINKLPEIYRQEMMKNGFIAMDRDELDKLMRETLRDTPSNISEGMIETFWKPIDEGYSRSNNTADVFTLTLFHWLDRDEDVYEKYCLGVFSSLDKAKSYAEKQYKDIIFGKWRLGDFPKSKYGDDCDWICYYEDSDDGGYFKIIKHRIDDGDPHAD